VTTSLLTTIFYIPITRPKIVPRPRQIGRIKKDIFASWRSSPPRQALAKPLKQIAVQDIFIISRISMDYGSQQ